MHYPTKEAQKDYEALYNEHDFVLIRSGLQPIYACHVCDITLDKFNQSPNGCPDHELLPYFD